MTQIIAHRGVRTVKDISLIAPENTQPAFNQAGALDVGVELDVQATKDGKLVVYHDDKTGKVFSLPNGDKLVINSTYDELEQAHLNVSGHEKAVRQLLSDDPDPLVPYKTPNVFKRVKIPLLSDVIQSLPKTQFFLEMKTSDKAVKRGLNNGLEEKVVQLIQDKNLYDRVTVISFSKASLKKIKKLDENIKTGLDIAPSKWVSKLTRFWAWYGKKRLNLDSIHPSYANTTDQFIKNAHQQGLKIMPWVHKETRAEESNIVPQLIKNGVDGIITNSPDLFIN